MFNEGNIFIEKDNSERVICKKGRDGFTGERCYLTYNKGFKTYTEKEINEKISNGDWKLNE